MFAFISLSYLASVPGEGAEARRWAMEKLEAGVD